MDLCPLGSLQSSKQYSQCTSVIKQLSIYITLDKQSICHDKVSLHRSTSKNSQMMFFNMVNLTFNL